jgi:hypothetical protein
MYLWKLSFLGGFAELQKATFSFFMSVCPSIRMKKTRLSLN